MSDHAAITNVHSVALRGAQGGLTPLARPTLTLKARCQQSRARRGGGCDGRGGPLFRMYVNRFIARTQAEGSPSGGAGKRAAACGARGVTPSREEGIGPRRAIHGSSCANLVRP